jgi:hypothetical protein
MQKRILVADHMSQEGDLCWHAQLPMAGRKVCAGSLLWQGRHILTDLATIVGRRRVRCDASVRLLQAHRLVRICKNRSQWPRERTHEAEGGPVLPAQCRVIVWAPACSCQFIRPSSSPFTTTRSDFRRQRDGNGIHRFPLLLHWGKIASG